MSLNRNTPSCAGNPSVDCPDETYCRAKTFKPGQRQISALADELERQPKPGEIMKQVSLKNMEKTNEKEGRSGFRKYRPMKGNDGQLIAARDGVKGSVLGYQCVPMPDHMKTFADDNRDYIDAFQVANDKCRGIDPTPSEEARAEKYGISEGMLKNQKYAQCMAIQMRTLTDAKFDVELPKVGYPPSAYKFDEED